MSFSKEREMKFGRLKEVNVRELWKHEQYDFSGWLSKDENIELLSDEDSVKSFSQIQFHR